MHVPSTLAAIAIALTFTTAAPAPPAPANAPAKRNALSYHEQIMNEKKFFFPVNRAVATPGPGGAVPINSGAVSLIESLEGFEPNFYTINGDKTIGYGHDCTQRGGCDSLHPPITQAQGQALLMSDLTEYETCVCALPNASGLNSNQYGALVSFTYNSGCGGVQKYFTTDMNNKDYSGICSQLPTTNTLNGELSSRRQKEGAFCSQATSAMSGC